MAHLAPRPSRRRDAKHAGDLLAFPGNARATACRCARAVLDCRGERKPGSPGPNRPRIYKAHDVSGEAPWCSVPVSVSSGQGRWQPRRLRTPRTRSGTAGASSSAPDAMVGWTRAIAVAVAGTSGDREDGPVTGPWQRTKPTRTAHSQCTALRGRSLPEFDLYSDSGMARSTRSASPGCRASSHGSHLTPRWILRAAASDPDPGPALTWRKDTRHVIDSRCASAMLVSPRGDSPRSGTDQ